MIYFPGHQATLGVGTEPKEDLPYRSRVFIPVLLNTDGDIEAAAGDKRHLRTYSQIESLVGGKRNT